MLALQAVNNNHPSAKKTQSCAKKTQTFSTISGIERRNAKQESNEAGGRHRVRTNLG